MENTGNIIDLTAFRRNESQELSLFGLLEQAEKLVTLQEAVLDKYHSAPLHCENRVAVVVNSMRHLRDHLGLIKRLIPQA
jgi:hypothetical protein